MHLRPSFTVCVEATCVIAISSGQQLQLPWTAGFREEAWLLVFGMV